MYRIQWKLETAIGELRLVNDNKIDRKQERMDAQQAQDSAELKTLDDAELLAGQLAGTAWGR